MSYPTAWMSRHDNHIVTFDRLLVAEAENAGVDNWIPLYTTPQTKPLSDEEIEEVIRKHWNREYGNRNMLTLCRAVLEEANK